MKSNMLRVLLLLAVAALLDHVTGPVVTADAFYIFPVALAGWYLGSQAGMFTSLVATALNLVIEWNRIGGKSHLLAPPDAGLHLIIFLMVCWLICRIRQQQNFLTEQRDEIQTLYGRMEREMRAARSLQKLLTGELPVHPAVEIQTHFQTARILGGDTIYLTLASEDQLAIIVGDVSGKGSPAALAGAVLIGLLEEAMARFKSPAQTLSDLNERLVSSLPDEMFVTLFYGLLDLKSGTLVFANAGHEYPFHFSGSGAGSPKGEALHSFGLPLGLFNETVYEDYRVTFSPGDLLFCYTDGLTDQIQADGERVGSDKLLRLLEENQNQTCAALIREVLNGSISGLEEIGDDISMVAIRYRPDVLTDTLSLSLSGGLSSGDRESVT